MWDWILIPSPALLHGECRPPLLTLMVDRRKGKGRQEDKGERVTTQSHYVSLCSVWSCGVHSIAHTPEW